MKLRLFTYFYASITKISRNINFMVKKYKITFFIEKFHTFSDYFSKSSKFPEKF